MRPTLRFVVLIFCLGCAFFSPTVAHAQKERIVNFYNWSDYIDPAVIEAFRRETGIKLRYDTFDANETLETKLLAGKSGYDVVVPTGYFLQRQIAAGVFQKLDKSKLPNLVNAWPDIAGRLAFYDPGNQYAVNYMWGTTGIGYNVKKMQEVLGPTGKIDSWDAVFRPDALARFKGCGIHMLDSVDDIVPAALHYVGLDPNSTQPKDLDRASDLDRTLSPGSRAAASTCSTRWTTSCRRRCIMSASIRIRPSPRISIGRPISTGRSRQVQGLRHPHARLGGRHRAGGAALCRPRSEFDPAQGSR